MAIYITEIVKLTLINYKGTCVSSQRIIQGHYDHVVAVGGLLSHDPFWTVLWVYSWNRNTKTLCKNPKILIYRSAIIMINWLLEIFQLIFIACLAADWIFVKKQIKQSRTLMRSEEICTKINTLLIAFS